MSDPRAVRRCCCSTAGHTTSTATPTSRRCSPTRATGSSSRTSVATAPPGSARRRRSGTASRRPWPSTRSPCWTRWGSRPPIFGGFDWGARTAAIVAALWPERCTGLVSVSGYLIGSQEANRKPLPPSAELALVVPVLLRHRPRAGRLRHLSARLREAHLAHRLAPVVLRRRHLRPERRGPRQPGPRRHRDPQLPLADRRGRRRPEVRRAGGRGWQRVRRSRSRRSPWRATRTGRRTRPPRRIARSSRAPTGIG